MGRLQWACCLATCGAACWQRRAAPTAVHPCCSAVSTAGERVDGFASQRIRSERLLVYHYVTKSLQVGRNALAGDRSMRRTAHRPPVPALQRVQRCKLPAPAAADVPARQQDFQGKMRRGGGLGVNFRDMDYWDKVQSL